MLWEQKCSVTIAFSQQIDLGPDAVLCWAPIRGVEGQTLEQTWAVFVPATLQSHGFFLEATEAKGHCGGVSVQMWAGLSFSMVAWWWDSPSGGRMKRRNCWEGRSRWVPASPRTAPPPAASAAAAWLALATHPLVGGMQGPMVIYLQTRGINLVSCAISSLQTLPQGENRACWLNAARSVVWSG